MNFNVGIIGCGLMGKKRALALKKFKNSKLIKVADADIKKAKELALEYKCEYTDDWKEITGDNRINIVIISTSHDMLSEIAISSLKNKKHILVEKPAGRNPEEIKKIIDTYESLGKKYKIKVGFNHRFHPAFEKAKEIIEKEKLGEIMFIRAYYGHGGRPGYEKEWRAKKKISGGGEMLDQGSHLIDLSRYFLGDFSEIKGYCETFFWNMEVEDNGFALLRTDKNQIAQLHASWTQWKNAFSFEIFCKKAQININGLGGSYGKETLTLYKMKPEMGIPDKFVHEWIEDNSWEKEYENLIKSIEVTKEPNGNIYDAYESIKLIYQLYEKQNAIKK